VTSQDPPGSAATGAAGPATPGGPTVPGDPAVPGDPVAPGSPVAAGPAAAEPVRATSAADKAWAELAAQLTPAASMARIDAVTARAVTTITVIGLLLTGLGALGADQFAKDSAVATALAVTAVIVASLAVACALTAQVLTITRRLNPADLEQVKAWYRRQFTIRARATQAATVLLILAALLAGATAATALLTAPAAAGPAATTHLQRLNVCRQAGKVYRVLVGRTAASRAGFQPFLGIPWPLRPAPPGAGLGRSLLQNGSVVPDPRPASAWRRSVTGRAAPSRR